MRNRKHGEIPSDSEARVLYWYQSCLKSLWPAAFREHGIKKDTPIMIPEHAILDLGAVPRFRPATYEYDISFQVHVGGNTRKLFKTVV